MVCLGFGRPKELRNIYLPLVRWIVTILLAFLSTITIGQNHYQFIENNGQWPEQVHFSADLEIGNVYYEGDRFTYNITDFSEISRAHGHGKTVENPQVHGHAYQQIFLNTYLNSVEGNNKTTGTRNFFLGNDPSHWAADCEAFGELVYESIYPGIDLRVYSNDFFLKYDFIVHPGADESQIRWTYEGDVEARLSYNRLEVTNSVIILTEQKPIAWTMDSEQSQTSVTCLYREYDDGWGFTFPEDYDHTETLIIDPELIFSTYSGSTSDNFGYTATYDSDGFLYSGSSAFGSGYPATLGAYQDSWAGGTGAGTLTGTDIVISKYDTTGTFMVWSTYIGGESDELPHSLIVDSNDELILLGTTSSPNYPFTDDAYDTSFAGGGSFAPSGVGVDYINGSDIILTRLNANGSALVGSTFIGGTDNDGINQSAALKFNYADEMRGEIEIDLDGNICVSSCTFSDDFPMVDAFQNSPGGALDGCLFKMSPQLDQLLWSTFIGGVQDDALYAMAIDEENNLVVCGGTESSGFLPNTGYQTQNLGGQADGFVIKVDNETPAITASTYLGSPWYDQTYFVELGSDESVYLYGQTMANADYFIQNAAYGQEDGGMLVACLDNDLGDLQWSTMIGTGSGKPNLSPTAFLVDVCGKIYLSGWGGSTNVVSNPNTDTVDGMPITSDAFQSKTNGSDFYLMVLDSDANALVYASFFGGGVSNEHVDGGSSRFDPAGVVYQSVCAGCGGNSDFPILPSNAVSPTNNSSNCNNGVFKFNFELPPVESLFTLDQTPCALSPLQFMNQSTSALTYTWDFGDGDTSDEMNPIHVYEETGTYLVTLLAENENCGYSDFYEMEITLSELEPGVVYASAEPEWIQEGDSSQLDAFPDGYNYTWSPAESLDNPNSQAPVASPSETTVYTVIISDGDCTHADTVRVVVDEIVCGNPYIYVPNAFTPNADGQNELLYVRGENITDLYFTIYDRWGEEVFSTTNQEIGWDGKYEGDLVDPAVFVYYLEVVCANGQLYFEKGNITVIR